MVGIVLVVDPTPGLIITGMRMTILHAQVETTAFIADAIGVMTATLYVQMVNMVSVARVTRRQRMLNLIGRNGN